MKSSSYQFCSPLARPFRSRLANWKRKAAEEASPLRLDGGLLLRRFIVPAPVPAAEGRRIAFVSDLHWHSGADESRRLCALAEALKECRPELMLLGGDAVGDASGLDDVPAALRRLSACAPAALAVPGNWERGKRWLGIDFWKAFYAEGGFELLCNESCELGAFFVYGSDDLVHGCPEPPPRSGGNGKCRIILTHRPDALVSFDCGESLADWHLALCGHTHGGQWRLPLLGPLFVPGFYFHSFDRGWFVRRGTGFRMFVSSGAGELSLPGRLNCPREAVLIDFVRAPEV